MTDNAKDRILNAFLEEILGEQAPPDLTDPILRALSGNPGEPASGEHDNALAGFAGVVDPPPIQQAGAERCGHITLADRGYRPGKLGSGPTIPNWLVATGTALSIILLGVAIGLVALMYSGRSSTDPPPVAQTEHHAKTPAEPTAPVHRGGEFSRETSEEVPFPDWLNQPEDPASTELATTDGPRRRTDLPVPSPDAEVIAMIDRQIRSKWQDHQVSSSGPASDEQWCRRVYDRLIGRAPTDVELRAFARKRPQNKRSRLVNQLLSAPEYASHWSRVWAETLLGLRAARGELGESLQGYLVATLAEGKAYDQWVYELLTARGSAQDSEGAASFLLAGLGNNAKPATIHVSRVFLGQHLQCAECHDHQIAGIKKREFWERNSFFRQLKTETRNGAVHLVDRNWPADEVDVYFEQPDQTLGAAVPLLPDGTQVARDGSPAGATPREQLADWIIRSDSFSRALVNRLWAHFFRFGFTEQVDDLGPHQTPSHPELLDGLATEFMAHQYDLKRLARWLVLSETFGQSREQGDGGMIDLPQFGRQPLFTRYYERQPAADRFVQSLAATQKAIRFSATHQFGSTVFNGLNGAAGQASGVNLGAEDPNTGVEFAGQLAVGSQRQELIRRLTRSSLPAEDKIRHVFLAVVARLPTSAELQTSKQLYADNHGSPEAALEVISLALVNSSESILDR